MGERNIVKARRALLNVLGAAQSVAVGARVLVGAGAAGAKDEAT